MASSGVAFERSSQAGGFRAAPAVFRISRRRCCHPECGNRNNDKTYFKKSVAPLRGSLDIPTFHIATTHTEKLSCPVLRLIKLERLFLTRAGLRLEIVDPADKRRQAHENRLGTAASFQSENRPSIVEQVEFYVTAAAVELILSFVIAIGLTQTALRDGQVRLEERIADISNEGKVLLSISFKVIEEYAADTAHLSAMLQGEILVAPFLKPRIKTGVVALACLFDYAMKVRGIFCPGVTRREIRSSAEPRGIALLQVSKVRMNRGDHWTAGVKHQRYSGGRKFCSCTERDLRCELLRKVPVYRGKIHTGFLENLSFLENACAPSTASRALPCVFAKAASIEFLDSPGDSILQLSEIRFGVFTPTRAFHHTGRIIYNYDSL